MYECTQVCTAYNSNKVDTYYRVIRKALAFNYEPKIFMNQGLEGLKDKVMGPWEFKKKYYVPGILCFAGLRAFRW